MSFGWPMFGTTDEPNMLHDGGTAKPHLDSDVGGDLNLERSVKDGTSRCVDAPISFQPSAIRIALPTNSSIAWSALKRNDSAEFLEMSGVLPSVYDVLSSSPAIKKSPSKVQRPGLPPTAPRSPPALAFSRRGGRSTRPVLSKATGTLSVAPTISEAVTTSNKNVTDSQDEPRSNTAALVANMQTAAHVLTSRCSESATGCAATASSLSLQAPVKPLADVQGGSTQSGKDSGGGNNDKVDAQCPAPPLPSRPLDETRELPTPSGCEPAPAPKPPLSSATGYQPSSAAVEKPDLFLCEARFKELEVPAEEAKSVGAKGRMDGPPPYADIIERERSVSTAFVPAAARSGGGGQEPSAPEPTAEARAAAAATTLRESTGAGVVANRAGGGKRGSVDSATDEEGEPRRSSSLRRSSFVNTPRSLSGLGLRGCLPRRSPPPEATIRALPSNQATRLLGGSRSSTPKESPKGTPSRLLQRRKTSRQASSAESGSDATAESAATHGVSAAGGPMTAIGFDNVARGTRAPESGSTSAGERRQSAGREGLSAGVQEVQTTRTSANVSVNGDFSDEAKEKLPEEPEAVVAASVSMKGLLECGRAMRMDGTFVGQLVSTGSITVGPTGKVTGHLKGLKFLRVEGLVVGDVVCEKVMVLKEGKVFGDISASSLTLGPDTTVKGRVHVVHHPELLLQSDAGADDSVVAVGVKDSKKHELPAKDGRVTHGESQERKEETQVAGTGTESEDQLPIPVGSTQGKVAEDTPLKHKEGTASVMVGTKMVQKQVEKLQQRQKQQKQQLEKHAFSDDESQGSEVEGEGEDESLSSGARKDKVMNNGTSQQQSAGQSPPEKAISSAINDGIETRTTSSSADEPPGSSPSKKLAEASENELENHPMKLSTLGIGVKGGVGGDGEGPDVRAIRV